MIPRQEFKIANCQLPIANCQLLFCRPRKESWFSICNLQFAICNLQFFLTLFMRLPVIAVLLLLATCGCGPSSSYDWVRIDRVRIGFRPYPGEEGQSRYKLGLWTPVYAELQNFNEHKELPSHRLIVETQDSEDGGMRYAEPLEPLGPYGFQRVVTYAKPLRGSLQLTVANAEKKTVMQTSAEATPLDLGARLVVTLGGALPDLPQALLTLEESSNWPRFAAYEDTVDLLPTRSFGYEGVDLLILTTARRVSRFRPHRDFLTQLHRQKEKLAALAGWVRRGGRLVIGVNVQQQQAVNDLLRSPAWNPPLPVVLLPGPAKIVKKAGDLREPEQLSKLETWAKVRILHAFPEQLASLQIAKETNPLWDVLAAHGTDDPRPLIARLAYGLGSITFLAFDLEQEPFAGWPAKKKVLAHLIGNLEPPLTRQDRRDRGNDDLATQMGKALDQFDVPRISFGWVAFFIVIYITIAGLGDYWFLHKVLRRPEWMWLTFPLVVGLAGLATYGTAGRLQQPNLLINKVDLVDFDLRTTLNAQGETRQALAQGQTWFSVRSPENANYTLRLEPGLDAWGLAQRGAPPAELTWLGRPEPDGPGSYGRPRAGLPRRPYALEPGAVELRRVPIPIGATKAFTASWEISLRDLPFLADLEYHPGGEITINTLTSRLPVDVEDAWLLFSKRCYALPGPIRKGEKLKLVLKDSQRLGGWGGAPLSKTKESAGRYEIPNLLKWIAFHELVDDDGKDYRNHLLRPLDLSWRLKKEDRDFRGLVHEVILFGRVPLQQGRVPEVSAPTILKLTAAPQEPPAADFSANLVQHTFVRALLPIRPKK